MVWAAIAFIIVASWAGWRLSRASRLPRPGECAPDFVLPDQHGVRRALGEFRGRWLALYFYPRDDTPGCTRQALCFRDAAGVLEQRGVVVCGVSVDDPASHAAFARKHALPFVLLADRAGIVAARYGSLLDLGFVKLARRNTFLVDPQGVIASVRRGASPATSAEDLIQDLAAACARAAAQAKPLESPPSSSGDVS